MISDTNGGIFGDPDQRLARRQAESPSAQALADAQELLSAAHVHAELLRVHADAARAEAESLRVEAGALRRAAHDEAAAAGARAEALIAQVHAKSEEARAAMEGQANAARAEVERLTTETASLRRLVQGEIGAALAATEEIRAEVQSLWAEIGKLAAELRLAPSSGAGVAPPRVASTVVEHGSHTDGRLDELYRAMKVELEQRMADKYADTDKRLEPVVSRLDLTKLLSDIWDGASRESPESSERGLPAGGEQPRRPRASEPLIGSGGWRAGTAPTPSCRPDEGPVDTQRMSPPPEPAAQSRRFGRRG